MADRSTGYVRAAAVGVLLSWVAAAAGAGGKVTQLTLVNAETDRDIRALKDGATVNTKSDGERLNIRADVSGDVGSVRFVLDGEDVKTENVAPYSLAGDSRGDYSAWKLGAGRHTLRATPYGRAGGQGAPGTALSVTFTMVGRAKATAARKRGREDGKSMVAPVRPVPPAVTMKPGSVKVSGEMKKWHKVTIAFAGPAASETAEPNPFTEYRLSVTLRNGDSTYAVPGYYAADGNAAESGAAAGNVWMAHFCPDRTGTWTWTASFRKGSNVAVSDDPEAGAGAGPLDGAAGTLKIGPTDKKGRDHRAKGRLKYVGGHHLRFAETGEYFLKCGADAPENFLAYEDFDNTPDYRGRRKSWAPHVKDWRPGDPTWRGGKGKGIIGALSYLAREEHMNAFSFLTMNIRGDDRNVFPYPTDRPPYTRFDCSKLAQWEIVFEHADHLGMYLHFKTLETENELLLDNGDLGNERKLYYRELIARFGHHLALNWNLGEEINNATTSQKQAWARYFWDHDPCRNHIVIHNGANHYDLLGSASKLTGFSLQTNRSDFSRVHSRTKDYIDRSAAAGKPWVVACDEPGDAQHALRPDNDAGQSHTDGRKNALWGNLMAGGAGLEFYFGYAHGHSDLTCEDFRSRDRFWDYCRHALSFFRDNDVPFWEMVSDNALSAASNDYCLCKPGQMYVVYLKNGGTTSLDLSGATGTFDVRWYDPRNGGRLRDGSVRRVNGGGTPDLGRAPDRPDEDWVVLVRKVTSSGGR